MSDFEPIILSRPQNNGYNGGGKNGELQTVAFDRTELGKILRIYGFQVAAGEWRDYAIDMTRDKAVFSVFRHSCEVPLYRIEKTPGWLANKELMPLWRSRWGTVPRSVRPATLHR